MTLGGLLIRKHSVCEKVTWHPERTDDNVPPSPSLEALQVERVNVFSNASFASLYNDIVIVIIINNTGIIMNKDLMYFAFTQKNSLRRERH